MKLTHVRLLVINYAECVRFYRDMMGFEMGWGSEESGYADFKAGSTMIALFGRQEMAEAVGQGGLPAGAGAQDRAMLIFGVESVDQVCETLRAKDVTFVTEPMNQPDWGIRVAHFRDPDGNLIELNSDLV